jgi:hypothetical protein
MRVAGDRRQRVRQCGPVQRIVARTTTWNVYRNGPRSAIVTLATERPDSFPVLTLAEQG